MVQDWLEKGVELSTLEKYDEALLSYDKALKINPKDHDTWNSIAMTLAITERYEEALPKVKKSLDLEPDDPYTVDTHGFILYHLEKYEDALAELSRAVELDPTYSEAWYHKGDVFLKKKKYDDALKCYDRALEISPKFAEVHNAKAVALSYKGDFEKAKVEAKKAIAIKPNFADAHENFTKLLLGSRKEGQGFWVFWSASWGRKLFAVVMVITALGLILQPLLLGYETSKVEIREGVAPVKTTTITKEFRVPETNIIAAGLLLVVLLVPEIRKAKIGALELDLKESPAPPSKI